VQDKKQPARARKEAKGTAGKGKAAKSSGGKSAAGKGKSAAAGGKKSKKSPKVDLDPQPCVCGCEAMSRTGGFAPGHDSKLKGAILRVIKAQGGKGQCFEGEREMVKKLSRDKHPALNTSHFRALFDQVK
jgi:hypothetical protein